MNNEVTTTIKMKQKDAINLDHGELKKREIQKKDVFQEDGLYRHLYQPKLEGGQQRRATDMIWSWNTFLLDRNVEEKFTRVLYYLRDGPKCYFVREELIPKNT